MNLETADQRLVTAKLATERSPDDVAAWIALSQAHEGLLDYKSMTAAARRAVALQPDNVDAVRQLAYSLVQTGSGWVDFEDKTMLDRLLQLAPHDLTALHYLNIHALRDGDYARALKLAETLERVAPGDPAIAARIGRAHRLLGNAVAAEKAFALAAERCENELDPFPYGPHACLKPVFTRLAGHSAAAERQSVQLCQEDGIGLADLANPRYPPECGRAIARLQGVVAGRDLFVFGNGPSLQEVVARRDDIGALDFASMSMSSFQIIDDDVLRPIGKRLDIACMTHPTMIEMQAPHIATWFSSVAAATLIAPLWLRERPPDAGDVDILGRWSDRIFWFDCRNEFLPSPRDPLHFPAINTLICAIGPAVLAKPRRIFLFGFDGQIKGRDSEVAGALYYREEHAAYQMTTRTPAAVRRATQSWLWWDSLRFNELAPTVVRHVALLFDLLVPPIYNVCADSALTVFPRLTFERFRYLVSEQATARD